MPPRALRPSVILLGCLIAYLILAGACDTPTQPTIDEVSKQDGFLSKMLEYGASVTAVEIKPSPLGGNGLFAKTPIKVVFRSSFLFSRAL